MNFDLLTTFELITTIHSVCPVCNWFQIFLGTCSPPRNISTIVYAKFVGRTKVCGGFENSEFSLTSFPLKLYVKCFTRLLTMKKNEFHPISPWKIFSHNSLKRPKSIEALGVRQSFRCRSFCVRDFDPLYDATLSLPLGTSGFFSRAAGCFVTETGSFWHPVVPCH